MDRYFILGPIPGSPYTRYAVLSGEHTVIGTQVSRPGGVEVPRPNVLRFSHKEPNEVKVRQMNAQEWKLGSGQQPRRPTWRRAGKRVAQQ